MERLEPLLDIHDLSVVYPSKRGPVRAVDSLYMQVMPGGKLGLVGESGCGKSTVLHAILRLIHTPGKVTGGEILFKGQTLNRFSVREMRSIRGREISMIFQDPQTTLNPSFYTGEQIRESLRLHHIIPGAPLPWPFDRARMKQEKERVLQALHEVGIPSPKDIYHSYPHQLSGGMQQRALIALALVCGPSLLLADEPTTALDVTIQAQIIDLMLRINREHRTAVILVTHDLGVAAEFCETIAVMYAGRIVERNLADDVVNRPRHPYTRGLLSCRPRIEEARQKVSPIPGNVPDMGCLPPGCAFTPRCPLARPACEQGPVPLLQFNNHSFSRCIENIHYERDPAWTWEQIVRV